MIHYEVTLEAPPALAGEVEEYMRSVHIPDIWATGCFERIEFSTAAEGRFRTVYTAPTRADLDRYLHAHAPRLRGDFVGRFGDTVAVRRECWEAVQRWP